MTSDFWIGTAVGAIICALLKWFFDYLRTLFERGTLLVVTVHRAFPRLQPPECYFVRLVNHTPDRTLEIKDVWFEGAPATPVLNPQRRLPVTLAAGSMWETWIPVTEVHTTGETAFTSCRVRLSTGEVFRSTRTPDQDLAPDIGGIAGG